MRERTKKVIAFILVLMLGLSIGFIAGYITGYDKGAQEILVWGLMLSKNFITIDFDEIAVSQALLKYKTRLTTEYAFNITYEGNNLRT